MTYRCTAVLMVAIGIVAVTAPVASAGKPTREHITFPDRTFSASICGFSVSRHVLVNRSVETTFDDGSTLLTGTFIQEVKNDVTGKTIIVNASGPVRTVFNTDGSSTEYATGPQFIRPPGELLLTTGPTVVERDASGAITSFTQEHGTQQDVCELLA